MGFTGDSAAGLHREVRAFSEGDSQTDSCGDCQSDFPADSHRDSQADLRRGLRGDLQGDFHGDFDGVSRAEEQQRKRIGHEITKARSEDGFPKSPRGRGGPSRPRPVRLAGVR